MNKPDYIVSDVHLGAIPPATQKRFLQWLDHVSEYASRLIIAGDLFDFWFEYGPVIPGRQFRVLAALARLIEDGIPVLMVGGNHDAWGGSFLRNEVGITFTTDTIQTELAGLPALITHGDGVGPGDLRYRILKRVLRSGPVTAAFRWLHPSLGVRLARAVSSTETKSEQTDRINTRAQVIERWAADRLASEARLAWVVCGHAHRPAIREVAPGRFYLNPGDWVTHDSYITVSADGHPALHTWRDHAAAP